MYNCFVKEPRAIRFFYSEVKAYSACKLLKSEGFDCYVEEDMFEKLTLDKVGMKRRYRLYVERTDIFKIAEVLAQKMRSKS